MIEVSSAITAGGTATLFWRHPSGLPASRATDPSSAIYASCTEERFLISDRSDFPCGFRKPSSRSEPNDDGQEKVDAQEVACGDVAAGEPEHGVESSTEAPQ